MMIAKPWGFEDIIFECPNYRVKRIVVNENHRTSLQYHKNKIETWFKIEDGKMVLFKHIPPLEVHRLVGYIDIIEIAYGSDDDIVRLEDDYKRV